MGDANILACPYSSLSNHRIVTKQKGDNMAKIIEFLKGKKTYICAAVIAVATFAQQVGWIDQATLTKVIEFVGAAALSFLRMAVTDTSK